MKRRNDPATVATVLPEPELSHGAFRLLQVLRRARSYTDGRGRVLRRVGQGYLAARCGHTTKRTVRRYLSELERAGRVTKVPHRRSFSGGRWYSLECQAYRLHEPVENGKRAGHTDRTHRSGPRFTGGAGGRPGAPERAPRVPETNEKPEPAPKEVRDRGIAALRAALIESRSG